LLPLLAGTWVALRARGRGVRREPRLGRHSRPFGQLRFDTAGTAAGRWVERLHLARLPVLVNVLKGDMSLVGPRAAAPEEMSPRDPVVRQRFDVRPGLVCLWWIRQRANIAYDDEVEVDAEYVRTRSGGDVGIGVRALVAGLYGGRSADAPPRLEVLGLRIDNPTMEGALDWIAAQLAGQGGQQVAFVNPHCANVAARDVEYRQALLGSGLCLADGIGMKLAGRLLGTPIRENVNGTDLFPRLCERLSGTGHSLYLLGGRPGVPEAVGDWLAAHYPGVTVSGCRDGYFRDGEEEAVVQGIAASGAAVLLVALGVPRQDVWVSRHLARTGARVALGVGGLFDFYSGRIRRAPLWMREIGLEWLYRFIQEPGRMWRRYFVGNAVFLARVCGQRLRRSLRRDG
ncbi:MAG: WecB/TagA/CpsF family glycosyltransferase, partial [Gemmatimonadota bacterium]